MACSNNSRELFNRYADTYHETVDKSLKISGEGSIYFAKARLNWTKERIDKLLPASNIKSILDYGCGIGNATPFINNIFKPNKTIGADVSEKSIELSVKNNSRENISFILSKSLSQFNDFNLVYCNGVFHHIPREKRKGSIIEIFNSLAENGIFAFWENNPWNPGTRYIMNKNPFDSDAVMLSTINSRNLLRDNGFNIIETTYCFIFPKALKFLRFMEKTLASIPIGAQYLILAQKKGSI